MFVNHLAGSVSHRLDQVWLGVLAARGHGRVGGGHVEYVWRCGTEDVGRVGLKSEYVFRQPCPDCGLHHYLGRDFEAERHVRSVDGALCRTNEVDHPVVGPTEVANRAVKALELHVVVTQVFGTEPNAAFEPCDEREGFECRARLRHVLGDGVALDLEIVGTAVHRGHSAGGGVHGHCSDPEVLVVVVRHLGDCLFCRLLVCGNNRRGHAVSTGFNLSAGHSCALGHFVDRLAQDVAFRTGKDIVVLIRNSLGELGDGVPFGLSEELGCDHPVEHRVPALFGAIWVNARVPCAGCRDDSCEHR